MTNDPRAGVPSASKLATVIACQGQDNLYRALLKEGKIIRDTEPDPLATFGINVHEARRTGNTLNLTVEETEAYDRGMEIERRMLKQWLDDNQIKEYTEVPPMSERLFLHHPETMDPIASGEIDVCYLALPHAVIIDWKSLGGYHAPPAKRNEQVRLYALLKWRDVDGIERIRVGINRCNERLTTTDWVDYSVDDLKMSEQSVLYHLWAARQEGAPRCAGPWCHFCECNAHCVEAAAYSLLPSVIAQRALPSSTEVTDMVAALAPPDLLKIFKSQAVIEKIFKAVKARLKGMPDEELAGIGLRKGDGRKLMSWTDAWAAYQFLRNDKCWHEDGIWRCLDFKLGELTKLCAKETGLTEKEADKEIRKLLSAYYEVNEGEKILREIK